MTSLNFPSRRPFLFPKEKGIAWIETFREHWNRWWFRKASPHGIAIFRIIFGLYMLVFWGMRLPFVTVLFSSKGLIVPMDQHLPTFLHPLLSPPTPFVAWLLFGVLLLSLTCLTIGAGTRTSAAVALLLYVYYMHLTLHSTSYNRLFMFLLFLFTFSDAGKAFSYEMWHKRGSFLAWEPVSVLTQRLIALQITATYLGVGWQKVWLPDWQGGEILLYSFQGMWATPLAFSFAREQFPMIVYDAMVLVVTYFECALPFGLWIPKLRLWFFAGGLLFHLGISLFLGAIWWFYAMPASYFLFYEPEEIASFLRKRFPGTLAALPSQSQYL